MIRNSSVLIWLMMVVVLAAAGAAWAGGPPEKGKLSVEHKAYGKTQDGRVVDMFTLKNAQGMEVRAINFGGIITNIMVPDKGGKFADVVLGFDSLDGYLTNPAYFGAIVGRYANRIANAKFSLDGKEYTLAKNDGPNTLHGGRIGFNKALWHAESFNNAEGVGVIFTYTSKDGEEGYPGNLKARVTYTLNDKNELSFDYHATTDKATVVNLTQHSYFDLAGDGVGDILAHHMMLSAGRFTPVDKNLIPTGELRPVKGTPLDFSSATAIGARINDSYEQMALGRGYDHCFVVNRKDGDASLAQAAKVHDPASGRVLEVLTTEPGIQFYSGNFLDGSITGKQGHVYNKRTGFALETQHFPDSPNHPSFPTTTLKPGETYHSRTVYRFSVE